MGPITMSYFYHDLLPFLHIDFDWALIALLDHERCIHCFWTNNFGVRVSSILETAVY